jgi:hypothetical protein
MGNFHEPAIIKAVEEISKMTPRVRNVNACFEIECFLCSIITPIENKRANVTTIYKLEIIYRTIKTNLEIGV